MKGDFPPEVRALLDAADQNDAPTAADEARIRGRLETKLGVPLLPAGLGGASLGGAVGAAAKGLGATSALLGYTSTGIGVKILGGVLLAVGLAGSVVVATSSHQSPPHAVPAVPAIPAVPSAVAVPAETQAPLPASASPPRVDPQAPTPPVDPQAPTPPVDPQAPTPPIAPLVVPSSVVPSVARESAPAKPLLGAPTRPPSPPRAAPADTDPVAAPSDGPSPVTAAPPSTAPTSSLPEEMALLRDAHAAVAAGKFDAALVPLDEHARRFPNGILAEERDAERAVALCGKGDRTLAASAFSARWPRSPLAGRVRDACAKDGAP